MDTQEKTIKDFGDQWGVYTTNDGYYASTELFQDILGPLLSINEIKNSKVIDVGSGTGRIMKMILDCGADFAVGIEPSDAFFVLKENLRSKKENILLLHIRGDEINFNNEFDYAFSIGVLHHIPNPNKTVKNIYDSLKINGRFIFWVYGKEGNSIYLTIILFIRKITTIIPHKILENFVNILDIFLFIYININKYIHLPLNNYIKNVLSKMSNEKRRLIIYDQLNPEYAKYYTENEAINLLKEVGFSNIKSYHRHGYSWTIIGTKI